MDQRELNKKSQLADFAWYLAGSLVVAIIAIIKLPVFTSRFTPEEFGIFSLVSITYTYLSAVLYNWITSCIYRYYQEFAGNGEKGVLFTNTGFLFLVSSILLLIISAAWYFFAGDSTVSLLVLLAFCFLFTNQLFSMFLVVFKLEGRSLHYNLYQALQALFSFLLILYMIFGLEFRIEAIFAGQIMVTLLLLVILFIKNRSLIVSVSHAKISREIIVRFMRYGFIGFISSAGIFVLISSDRYIIALFDNIGHVGIYNQVYQVGQVSIYFLVTVFFNAITPGLSKLLTGYSKADEKQLHEYIYGFIIIMVPVAFYLTLFARQVAEFLLGVEFRVGYTMIPLIVFSSFLYGLTLFNETRMKFDNKFKPVVWGVVIACVLNVSMNFILIPWLGYTWAAFTTLVAYLFLFIYYYAMDDLVFLKDARFRKIAANISVILALQFLADLLIRKFMVFNPDKWFTLVEAVLLFLLYGIVMIRLKLVNIGLYLKKSG
ncbi:MAG TPA: oligosaccharide flippase family protein [Bacteroidales bacterium]|nr:oligosaccharide flippase family protein [Bacteroidales bacterium]